MRRVVLTGTEDRCERGPVLAYHPPACSRRVVLL